MVNEERFKVIYNIGEGLVEGEIKDAKIKEIKIRDITEKLPDLVVDNEKVANQYVEYFNNIFNIDELDVVLNNVVKDVNFINKLNSELVAPEPTVYKDEETGEDIYDVPLKESLYYLGYQTKIHYITENINNNLALIKNIIYKE